MSDGVREFGQYLLVDRLAEGGMGEVFLARRRGSSGVDRLCVVKTIRAAMAQDAGLARRFLEETRLAVRLSHRNICSVFDVGVVDGDHFLAMDLVVGATLSQLLNRKKKAPLPLTTALYIISEVLEALDYAHRLEDPATGMALNVVHRDISPHNVMVTFEGEVKLIDFGVARSSLREDLTEVNAIIGKIRYMSPEQARGERVDARTDQFAAAVMLYELVAGGRFYDATADGAVWMSLLRGTYMPPGLQALPEKLRVILERALSPKPAARFESCRELAAAIDELPERQEPMMAHKLAALVSETLDDVHQDLTARIAHATHAEAQSASTSDTPFRSDAQPDVDPQGATRVRTSDSGSIIPTIAAAETAVSGSHGVGSGPMPAPAGDALANMATRVVEAPGLRSDRRGRSPDDIATAHFAMPPTVHDRGEASAPLVRNDGRIGPHDAPHGAPQDGARDESGLDEGETTAAVRGRAGATPPPRSRAAALFVVSFLAASALAVAALWIFKPAFAAALWAAAQGGPRGANVDAGMAAPDAGAVALAAPAAPAPPAAPLAVDAGQPTRPDAGPAVRVAAPVRGPVGETPTGRRPPAGGPTPPPLAAGADAKTVLDYLKLHCRTRVKCAPPILSADVKTMDAPQITKYLKKADACARQCARP